MDKLYNELNDNAIIEHNYLYEKYDSKTKWQLKKKLSHFVVDSFNRLGNFKKAEKIRNCADYLEFKHYSDGTQKLYKAYFCKDRLCPICNWRRTLKIYGQFSQIIDKVDLTKYDLLFATFTIKNCSGSDLSITLNSLLKGYHNLLRQKAFKSRVLGTFRALEITHNINPRSKSYNTYHPHIHCIFLVSKEYFNLSKPFDQILYLQVPEWSKMWQKALDLDYSPVCDVRKINNSDLKKSVCEVAKYSVKDSDFICDDINNYRLQDEVINYLSESLYRRRLVAYTGEFKKIYKSLKFDDSLDGDLINTDNETRILSETPFVIKKYFWNIGYSQYYEF